MHDDRAVADRGVLQDANGRHAVRAATVGESGILQSKAHVKRDTGVEAEGLVQGVLYELLTHRPEK